VHKLQALAKEADLTITNEQARQFLVYRSLLLEWNEKMNLTGITDPEAINIKHFIDSFIV
jgi:16S rRNA (guanine527-N7)-methyltransferase